MEALIQETRAGVLLIQDKPGVDEAEVKRYHFTANGLNHLIRRYKNGLLVTGLATTSQKMTLAIDVKDCSGHQATFRVEPETVLAHLEDGTPIVCGIKGFVVELNRSNLDLGWVAIISPPRGQHLLVNLGHLCGPFQLTDAQTGQVVEKETERIKKKRVS